MTTVPTEINAAAVKNSPTEKVTPMMQQGIPPMKLACQ
jgi:DNA mismatch repair protein MutS